MTARRIALEALIVLALAAAGVAVRAHDRHLRALDYDERTTLDYVEEATPEVFADYLQLRNVRDPGRLPLNVVTMQDFRTFPAFSVFARLTHQPDDPHANVARLRWVSIMFGGLAVPLAYLLGLRFGAAVGWLLAAFTLFHPTFHFHSQNIRFYSLLIAASTAGLAWYAWIMPAIPVWLADPRRRWLGRAMVVASGAVVGLMLTVHLGAIFPLAAMAVIAWMHLGPSRAALGLIVAVAAFAAVPLANLGHFFYVRAFADKEAEEMLNSLGPVSGLAAVAFNVGVGYCALAALPLLAAWRRGKTSRPILVGLALAAFGVFAAFALKAQMVRADYALGMFPLVLLAAALAVAELAKASGRPWATGAAVAGLALLLVLPTFVSNLAIDGDRVDYPTAIRLIRKDAGDRRSIVFADSPFAIQYLDTAPGVKPDYAPAKEAMSKDLSGYQRVYYVMREVKGLRSDRFAFAPLSNLQGKLLAIVGKDRFDLRVCRLYVFALEK